MAINCPAKGGTKIAVSLLGMKKSRKKELNIKNTTELSAILEELKEKLSRLQFDLRSGKTSNIKDIRLIKNEIAVISTIISAGGKIGNKNEPKNKNE